MGTDFGPARIIDGVLAALDHDIDLDCVLVGTPAALSGAGECTDRDRLRCHVSTQEIAMDEDPISAVRTKRNASTLRALELVRDGVADAAVSAASTGAVVLAAGALLGRTASVYHPALATIIASVGSDPTVLLDCGASTRREAAWLRQFAGLGSALAETFLGGSATVGLLANGVEQVKGDSVIRTAHESLQRDSRYIGLVESYAVFASEPNVVVTDGLLGNVLLKTVEATTHVLVNPMVEQLRPLGLLPFRDSLGLSVIQEIGWGAVLLGVNGVVVKAHGTGSTTGTRGAVAFAASSVRHALLGRIQNSRLGDSVP